MPRRHGTLRLRLKGRGQITLRSIAKTMAAAKGSIAGIILVLLAKIFHLDMFTCGVASLANIGGSASAPILAGAYSGALVPVGVLMALMGYVIGTAGGLITANIMSLLA